MNLTNKQISQMKKLYNQGEKIRTIAIKLKISPSTVSYHVSKGMRERRISQAVESFRNKTLEQRRKVYKQRAEYVKDWQREKYNKDKKFKEKTKAKVRKYYKNNKLNNLNKQGGKKNV